MKKQSLLIAISLFSLQSLQAQDARMTVGDLQQKLYGLGQTGWEKTKAGLQWIKEHPKEAAAYGLLGAGLTGAGWYARKSRSQKRPEQQLQIPPPELTASVSPEISREQLTQFPDTINVFMPEQKEGILAAIESSTDVNVLLKNVTEKWVDIFLAPFMSRDFLLPTERVTLYGIRGAFSRLRGFDTIVLFRFVDEIQRLALQRFGWLVDQMEARQKELRLGETTIPDLNELKDFYLKVLQDADRQLPN